MIKSVKSRVRIGKAMKVECTFKGKVEDYAMAWLHLTNNAREYPRIFLKHYNNSGCGVTVITPEKHVEEMKEYLESLSTYKWDGEKTVASLEVKVFNIEPVQTVTPLLGDWNCEPWDVEDDYAEILPSDEF